MLILAEMQPPSELPGQAPEPQHIEPRPFEHGFSLRRDQVTLTEVLSRASEAWSKDLGTWVLAMLLYWMLGIGIPFGLNLVWGFISAFQDSGADASLTVKAVNVVVQIALYLVQLVLSAVFVLGVWAMAIRGLHREPMSVAVLFSQLSKIWKYVVQSLALFVGMTLLILPILVIVFLVFVGPVDLNTPMNEIMDDAGMPLMVAGLLLLPVYAYVVSGLAFMQTELAFDDDAGPIEAITRSWRIAEGKRWKIIGIGLVAGFIFAGSAMMCGIGLLFGAPFATLVMGALYLGLRNGADVPAANTATTLGRKY
jgi:hypothetical protein